jgi:hypothetical protein
MNKILICFLMLLITGCATMHGVQSPPQQDRLEGLAKPDQIKITKNKITGASKLKLAIVQSANVEPQIKSYSIVAKQFDEVISSYVKESATVKSDSEIILSDKLFLQSIINSLRSRFAETIYTNDLASAFKQGADYAVIVDIRFEYLDLSSQTDPGPLKEKNVADISALFINKNVEGGPDIQVKNTSITERQPKGAEANIREMLNLIKNTRLKSLKDFEAELSKVVIK